MHNSRRRDDRADLNDDGLNRCCNSLLSVLEQQQVHKKRHSLALSTKATVLLIPSSTRPTNTAGSARFAAEEEG